MWERPLLGLTFCLLPASTTQTMNQWRRHWIRSFLNLTVGVYLTVCESCTYFWYSTQGRHQPGAAEGATV